jgi:hypothetical protein
MTSFEGENMANKKIWLVMLALALTLAGCDDDSGVEELLEVTHVNGFQGKLYNGSLLEIEVPSTADGNQTFTLYISGMKRGTGTLTLSSGSIVAIVSCTDTSLTYSGGVRYGGSSISMRPADNTVWVHWGVYYGATMADFNTFAQQHSRNADMMYNNRPDLDDEGYYPSSSGYDTPRNIYNQACADYPSDAPPISVLNQAIRVLNDHKNTGVGAYVSRGNLIAYYFRRIK